MPNQKFITFNKPNQATISMELLIRLQFLYLTLAAIKKNRHHRMIRIVIIFLFFSFYSHRMIIGQTCSYLIGDETIPEDIPMIYGHGIISKDSLRLYGISFSPKADELIYSVKTKGVYYMGKINGKWTNPQLMGFSKHSLTHIMYPKISPKGDFISFVDGNSKQYGFGDLFMIKKQNDNSWSDSIIKLPKPINSDYRDAGHCYTLNGKLYFTSGRDNKTGNNDIFVATNNNNEIRIEQLNKLSQFSISTDEECLFVSPSDDYIITDSWHQKSKRKQDLYISYKLDSVNWTDLKPLNEKINTDQFEGVPFVTVDNKFLFFTRTNNDKSNIYWVITKNVFQPYLKFPVPDVYEKVNQKIEILFSNNTFADFNGSIVDYDVYLYDNAKLPDWLTFNKTTLILSGQTDKSEVLKLILAAKDNDGNITETGFKMMIEK